MLEKQDLVIPENKTLKNFIQNKLVIANMMTINDFFSMNVYGISTQ